MHIKNFLFLLFCKLLQECSFFQCLSQHANKQQFYQTSKDCFSEWNSSILSIGLEICSDEKNLGENAREETKSKL